MTTVDSRYKSQGSIRQNSREKDNTDSRSQKKVFHRFKSGKIRKLKCAPLSALKKEEENYIQTPPVHHVSIVPRHVRFSDEDDQLIPDEDEFSEA